MPLYEINAGAPGDGVKPRLIEAKTRIGARSFAAKDTIQVTKVTPMRVAVLVGRGVVVESANEEVAGDDEAT